MRTRKQILFGLRRAALFSALLFFFVSFTVFCVLFEPFSSGGITVTVPDCVGKRESSLEIPDGISVETVYCFDASVPAGTVLSQSLEGGTTRKLSSRRPTVSLTITVSRGAEENEIPNLVGIEAREATNRLRALGFSVDAEVCKGEEPSGRVLSCNPPVGTLCQTGTRVTLFIGGGQANELVTVPNLVGLSRQEAAVTLWISRLGLSQVIEEPSVYPAGTVVHQSCSAGSRVSAGTEIVLYVSQRNE